MNGDIVLQLIAFDMGGPELELYLHAHGMRPAEVIVVLEEMAAKIRAEENARRN